MKMSEAKNPKWTKAWWNEHASEKTKEAHVGEALEAYTRACRSPEEFTSEKEFVAAVDACDKLEAAIRKAKPLCKTFQKETYVCLETYEAEAGKYREALMAAYQAWKERQAEAVKGDAEEKAGEFEEYFRQALAKLQKIHEAMDNLFAHAQLFGKKLDAGTATAEDFAAGVEKLTAQLDAQQRLRKETKKEWQDQALRSAKVANPAILKLVNEVTALDESLREDGGGLEKQVRAAIASLRHPGAGRSAAEDLSVEVERFKKLHQDWAASVGLLRQAYEQAEAPDQYQMMGEQTDARKLEAKTRAVEQERNAALEQLNSRLIKALKAAPRDGELRKLAGEVKDYKPVDFQKAVSGAK